MATKAELIQALDKDKDYKYLMNSLSRFDGLFSGSTRDMVSYFLTNSQITRYDLDILSTYVDYCLFVMNIGEAIYNKYKNNKDFCFTAIDFTDVGPVIHTANKDKRGATRVSILKFGVQELDNDFISTVTNNDNFSYLDLNIVLEEARIMKSITLKIRDVSAQEIYKLINVE